MNGLLCVLFGDVKGIVLVANFSIVDLNDLLSLNLLSTSCDHATVLYARYQYMCSKQVSRPPYFSQVVARSNRALRKARVFHVIRRYCASSC